MSKNLNIQFYRQSSYRSSCSVYNLPDDTRMFIFAGDSVANCRQAVTNFISNLLNLSTSLSNISTSSNYSNAQYKEVLQSTLSFSYNYYSVVFCSMEMGTNTSECKFGSTDCQLVLQNTNNAGVKIITTMTSWDATVIQTQRFDNMIANISITLSQPVPQLVLSFNLTGCVILPSTTIYDLPSTDILTITPDNGYIFDSIPSLTIGNDVYNFTISNNIATFDLSDIDYNTQVTGVITGVCREYVIANIQIESNNCEVSLQPSIFEKNSTCIVTIVAPDDYYFPIPPIVYTNCYDLSGENLPLTKINDYTYTVTMSGNWRNVSSGFIVRITANASINTSISDKYGLITLYKPTKSELTDLAQLRIYSYSDSQRTLVDLGQFITSLKAIYLDVEPVGNTEIVLGNTITDIQCPIIDNDVTVVDLGNVVINGFYNNNIDVLHSDIKLSLPFVGIVDLDSNIFINKTINLKYRINLITGVCHALIYILENNDSLLIKSYSGNIGMNIPYILQDNSFDYMRFNQTSVNDDLFHCDPCIDVFQNKKVNANERFFDTDKEVVISSLSLNDFISVDSIIDTDNISVILNEDFEMIITMLKGGIVI